MKVVITCQPALGHFHPLVPLARALQDAGHEVLFTTSNSFCPYVEEAGFSAVGAGLDWLASEVERTFPDLGPQPETWDEVDFPWQIALARSAHALAPDLVRLIRSLRPDLVVSESIEWAGPLAADATGVPYAVLGIESPQPRPVLAAIMGHYWRFARAALGLSDDPALTRYCPYLYLDPFPPSLHRVPVRELLDVAESIRPVLYEIGEATPPRWLDKLAPQPTVYVTMGTFITRVERLFRVVLAALADEPLNVIVTVGLTREPATLGAQPKHIRVERYIPHSLILPHVDLVVAHGGYNTLIGALSNGIPMLLLPQVSDQLYNAFRVHACGAGLHLEPRKASVELVREAVRELLVNPLYRQNAARLQAEIENLPPLESAIPFLERLASGGPSTPNRTQAHASAAAVHGQHPAQSTALDSLSANQQS